MLSGELYCSESNVGMECMHACVAYSKQTHPCKTSAVDLVETVDLELLATKDSVYSPCEVIIHTEEHHNKLNEKTNREYNHAHSLIH